MTGEGVPREACNCYIEELDGVGNHAPGCAIFNYGYCTICNSMHDLRLTRCPSHPA